MYIRARTVTNTRTRACCPFNCQKTKVITTAAGWATMYVPYIRTGDKASKFWSRFNYLLLHQHCVAGDGAAFLFAQIALF